MQKYEEQLLLPQCRPGLTFRVLYNEKGPIIDSPVHAIPGTVIQRRPDIGLKCRYCIISSFYNRAGTRAQAPKTTFLCG